MKNKMRVMAVTNGNKPGVAHGENGRETCETCLRREHKCILTKVEGASGARATLVVERVEHGKHGHRERWRRRRLRRRREEARSSAHKVGAEWRRRGRGAALAHRRGRLSLLDLGGEGAGEYILLGPVEVFETHLPRFWPALGVQQLQQPGERVALLAHGGGERWIPPTTTKRNPLRCRETVGGRGCHI